MDAPKLEKRIPTHQEINLHGQARQILATATRALVTEGKLRPDERTLILEAHDQTALYLLKLYEQEILLSKTVAEIQLLRREFATDGAVH